MPSTAKKDRPLKRPAKSELLNLLESHGGVVADVAKAGGWSRQSVYTWIAFYDKDIKIREHRLMTVVENARSTLYDVATDNVVAAVNGGDLDMSKFVLTHMPVKGRERWSNRTEVTGRDGTPLNATPELLRLMDRLGIDGDELMGQLERLLAEQAGAA